MSEALAVVDGEVVSGGQLTLAKSESAADLYRRATDVADVCREIVLKTAMTIQGKRYVKIDGWQSLANTFGCVASARDVKKVEGGITAIGEIRRMSDGAIIATGEGFVGEDEPMWAGRPEYARRAMAQTRACSRACRTAFAFVVTMIDANLSTTPAEEVPEGGFNDATKAMPKPAGVEALRQQVAPASPPRPVPGPNGAVRTHPPLTLRFGKATGKTSYEVTDSSLDWYIKCATESLTDPKKADYRQKNEADLAFLQAEKDFRAAK